DEHVAAGQEGGGVVQPGRGHGAGAAPAAGGGVIELGVGGGATPVIATGDEHLPAGEQGGGMGEPRRGHRGGDAPAAGGGVVQLGGGRGRTLHGSAESRARGRAASDDDLAVGQQGGGVAIPGKGHRAGG